MKKIYLTGYYGQNNLGDDYLFYSIVNQLSNLAEEVELNIEVGKENFETKLYTDIVENYENIKFKVTYVGGIKGKWNKLLSIVKANYWIVGGGGLFTSEDATRMRHFNSYLQAAHLSATKTCLYGIDIDSLKEKNYITEWKKVLSKVDFIETRNKECADRLRFLFGNGSKIKNGVDITHAFFTEEEEKADDKKEFLSEHNLLDNYVIWAIAMPWNRIELENPEIRTRYEKLCGQFCSILEGFSMFQHVFLPFYEDSDIYMVHSLVDESSVNYKIIDYNIPLGEKRLLFKYAKQAVVMRFHGIQFALFHCTPFMAVSYSPKATNILNELGLQDLYVEFGIRKNSCFMKVFDIDDTDFEKLKSNLMSHMYDVKVKEASERLKECAALNKELLLDWLKS